MVRRSVKRIVTWTFSIRNSKQSVIVAECSYGEHPVFEPNDDGCNVCLVCRGRAGCVALG